MQNSSSESRLLHSLEKQYMHISSTVKLNNGVEIFIVTSTNNAMPRISHVLCLSMQRNNFKLQLTKFA